MSLSELSALFIAMFVVAAVPGPAVFAVIARIFSSGFRAGLLMIIGITLGDYIFILLALFGLSVISQVMGAGFLFIKYASAAYLIYLGWKALKSKSCDQSVTESQSATLISSLVTGLMLNLGNPKAIVFYVGLFPAFVDIAHITSKDVFSIMTVATVAFGTVNIGYAFFALKAKQVLKTPNASSLVNKVAGTVMVTTGVAVAAKA